jgi:outer membrane murein-binding lipoprotein Lpp
MEIPITWLVTAVLTTAGLLWKVVVDSMQRAHEDGRHDGTTDTMLERIEAGVSKLDGKVSALTSTVTSLDANVRRLDRDMAAVHRDEAAARPWRSEVRAALHDVRDHAQQMEYSIRMLAAGDPEHAVQMLDLPRHTHGPIKTPRPQPPVTVPGEPV